MKRILLALMLTMLGAMLAHAQTPMILRTFSVDGGISDMRMVTPAGSVSIDIPGASRSEPMNYNGPRKLVFFREADQELEKPLLPAAEVQIPAGGRVGLLLFIKAPERSGFAKNNYYVRYIDDHPNRFNDQTLVFMNLTRNPYYSVIGEVKGETKGKSVVLQPVQIYEHKLPSKINGNLPLKIAKKEGNSYNVIFNSRVYPSRSSRCIFFLYEQDGKLRVRSLIERVDESVRLLREKLSAG